MKIQTVRFDLYHPGGRYYRDWLVATHMPEARLCYDGLRYYFDLPSARRVTRVWLTIHDANDRHTLRVTDMGRWHTGTWQPGCLLEDWNVPTPLSILTVREARKLDLPNPFWLGVEYE